MSLAFLGIACFLSACGGASDPPAILAGVGGPEHKENERLKLESEIEGAFSRAAAAIEKAKAAVSSSGTRNDDELLEVFSAAQSAIQDVAEQQKELSVQIPLAFATIREYSAKNYELSLEAIKLEKEKSDLQARERLFSMGFYTSLGVALLALVSALTKLPTALLDREYRKLEILEKRIELRIKRRASERTHQMTGNALLPTEGQSDGTSKPVEEDI